MVVLDDEVEDAHDVRVVEHRRQSGLALGAGQVGGIGAGHHADPLEGHGSPEHLVATEVDGTGAATTDLALEGVPACDHVTPSIRGDHTC